MPDGDFHSLHGGPVVNIDKIEEWIQEVEQRPDSAPNILRYIARRLSDLTERNEELLSDNLALRTGRRVEEYERRIANLEYQIDLLKRQLGGEIAEDPGAPGKAAPTSNPSLILFTALGQILRLEVDLPYHPDRQTAAAFEGEVRPGGSSPVLAAASSQEELVLLYDSGRTLTLPVPRIPASPPGMLIWKGAHLEEPQVGEELAAVLPAARMSLYEFVIQTSRRGFVKKLKEEFFETHLANHYIGAGVKLASDRTCGLTLCSRDDLFVLVTREGSIFSMEVSRLPFTIEEALRLSPSDQVLTSFVVQEKDYLLLAAQNGKIIQREASWVEPAASFKGRPQAAFSKARRDAGVRLVGAAAVREEDSAAFLTAGGKIMISPVSSLFSSGSLVEPGEEDEVLSFTVCR
jgi:DNA gyrase/topoisomerase IV subunit A